MAGLRLRGCALGGVVVAALLAACGGSSTSTPGQAFCPQTVPFVDILYPIPDATGVPAGVGQMIFDSTGVGRVRLIFGGYDPYSGKVSTKQEPLPNPLPSPLATSIPYGQYLTTTFAVSFERLRAHTKYHVQVWTVYNQAPCNGGEAIPSGWADIGSFSTQ
jgi:hypothetical protein